MTPSNHPHIDPQSVDPHRADREGWRQAVGRAASAISALSGGAPHDNADLEHRFAAAAWSSIAEPGDLDAGELVATLGIVGAARVVLSQPSVERVRAALREVGDDGALATEPDRLSRAMARWAPRARLERVVGAVQTGLRTGARMIVSGDDDWPSGCDDLGPAAPHVLWVRGDRGTAVIGDATQRAARLGAIGAVAIVGSRAATPYGERVAIDLADGLVGHGSVIISGGAYGIDVAAHRAALANDAPTIAVLAGGADRLYPAGNAEVLRRIMTRGGAVVSELPCGQAPTRWRFLRRNRLIAAMSAATIVVEAGRRSGALNTAGHAAQLGRPLGAVPGPITSVTSAGCHRLVRDYDAVLVTSVDEAIELVRGFGPGPGDHPELDVFGDAAGGGDRLDGDVLRCFDALSVREWQTPGHVAARAGLGESAVRGALAALQMAGRAAERAGAWRRVSQ